MRDKIRYFGFLFFVLVLLVMISGTADGQPRHSSDKPTKFSIDFELIPKNHLIGNDVPYGERYYLHQKTSGGAFPSPLPDPNNPYRLDYGLISEPLVAKIKSTNFFGGRVTYQFTDKWGMGLGGSHFETSGHDQGRVTTPPSDFNNFYVNGVGMFGQRLVPVRNDLESQGSNSSNPFSPVSYRARNRISISRGNVFIARNLFEQEKTRIALFIGLDAIRVSNERFEGQEQRAFISFMREFNFDHWDNNINLDLNSRADYSWMRGPSIGVQWELKLTKKLGLDVFAKQAFVRGKVKQSGVLTDVDDIKRVRGPRLDGSFVLIERARLEGRFPFSIIQNAVIPATDFNLKINYNLNKHLALGVGLTTVYLQNVAVAPIMNFPGLWTAVAGTSWVLQRRDLFLHGISTNISFSR